MSETNKKKETIGKISRDLLITSPNTADAIELEQEMHKDYEQNIHDAVNRFKKESVDDFYVVVETKKERLMQNVIRNYFIPRISCPTPS